MGVLTFLLVTIPFGILCGIKAVNQWRLYLTPSGIHYSKPTPCCCTWRRDIPFQDINDVSVISGTKTILVHLEPDKINDCCCCRPLINRTQIPGTYLENVANSEEFVGAVKKEMAAWRACGV